MEKSSITYMGSNPLRLYFNDSNQKFLNTWTSYKTYGNPKIKNKKLKQPKLHPSVLVTNAAENLGEDETAVIGEEKLRYS